MHEPTIKTAGQLLAEMASLRLGSEARSPVVLDAGVAVRLWRVRGDPDALILDAWVGQGQSLSCADLYRQMTAALRGGIEDRREVYLEFAPGVRRPVVGIMKRFGPQGGQPIELVLA
jgi:hypothetical protein